MDSIQYSSSEDELPPEPDVRDSKDRSSCGRSEGKNSSSSRKYSPEKRRSPDRRSPDSRRHSPIDRSYSRDRRHSPPDSRSRHRSSDSSRRSREDRHHKKYRSERGSSHRKEHRDRRTRSRSRSPARRSHHRDHGSPPRRRSKEKSPAPSQPVPPVKKPFDPQKKMLLLDKMGIDYKGTEEDQQPSGPSNLTTPTVTITPNAIPGLISPLLNTSRYEEQINKRKLLWNSKKAAPGNPNNISNTSIWQGAKFSQDQDGKVAAKFQRLMGMKEPVSGSATQNADSKGRDLIKKQEELFSSMEMQYEVARATTHTQRGVGLGFGPRHIP